jgi:hypothetical protein
MAEKVGPPECHINDRLGDSLATGGCMQAQAKSVMKSSGSIVGVIQQGGTPAILRLSQSRQFYRG